MEEDNGEDGQKLLRSTTASYLNEFSFFHEYLD